jgi:NTP pyrophosphatase (non-canonical NTP hydrolase)
MGCGSLQTHAKETIGEEMTDEYNEEPAHTYIGQWCDLTFSTLRKANRRRLPQFRDRNGKLAHSKPDGSDWSKAEWLQAIVGELGELGEFANLAKKVRRGDFEQKDVQDELADELADVQIYQTNIDKVRNQNAAKGSATIKGSKKKPEISDLVIVLDRPSIRGEVMPKDGKDPLFMKLEKQRVLPDGAHGIQTVEWVFDGLQPLAPDGIPLNDDGSEVF